MRVAARAMRWLTAGLAVATCAVVLPATASAAPATSARVPGTYFGMHVHAAGTGTLPSTAVAGSVRLWDTGTTWADIQPARDVWDWSRLDAAVAEAKRKRVRPLIVLGMTPTWASVSPAWPSPTGHLGSTRPPRRNADWARYVKAVVSRYYPRGVREFQTWNEPNSGFWAGSTARMAVLNGIAWDIVHATVADTKLRTKGGGPARKYPSALLVAPGMSTRRAPQLTFLWKYFAHPAARRVDVVSLHLYPQPEGTPEDALVQLERAQKYLRHRKVDDLPMWVTEINYGGRLGNRPEPLVISPALQPAYVARTLLLARSRGAERLYWYAWNNRQAVGVHTTRADLRTPTPAGRAWVRTRAWMSRGVLGCKRDRTGTWTCTVRARQGYGKVIWNPDRRVGVPVPGRASTTTTLGGRVSRAQTGGRLAVGPVPIYVATSTP